MGLRGMALSRNAPHSDAGTFRTLPRFVGPLQPGGGGYMGLHIGRWVLEDLASAGTPPCIAHRRGDRRKCSVLLELSTNVCLAHEHRFLSGNPPLRRTTTRRSARPNLPKAFEGLCQRK